LANGFVAHRCCLFQGTVSRFVERDGQTAHALPSVKWC
jgi:hypothetical protein